MRVCVLGLGYIGLPTAAVLARAGHTVIGVDVNPAVVETINRGEIHIVEPDLEGVVRDAVGSGRLVATTEVAPADVFLICVPTPFRESETLPTPDLEHVLAAGRAVAGVIRAGNLVILESTSPVGTTDLLRDLLRDEGAPIEEIAIAYCPERVLPGRILAELVSNNRIVGGVDETASLRGREFSRTFVDGEIHATDARTAEMTKLVENSFRDVNIAFANEVSVLCARLGIDPWELIALANRHPRVNVLQPSTGVGGHCVAVDPWFVVSADPQHATLIRTAREVNLAKTAWVIDQIATAADAVRATTGRTPVVALMGLAFKPNVDDLRESPAVEVATALGRRAIEVVAVEPHIDAHPTLRLAAIDDALEAADIVAFLVRHDAFLGLAPQAGLVLDFCGVRPNQEVVTG